MSAFETGERIEVQEGGSNRTFALVFCGAFVLVGLWPLIHHGGVRWWCIAIGVAFGIVGLTRPALLAPLQRVWMQFGLLLGKIVSPVVMGFLLYAVVTPLGFAQRLFGRDQLRLMWNPKASSYWEYRKPPGPPPESMSNQF